MGSDRHRQETEKENSAQSRMGNRFLHSINSMWWMINASKDKKMRKERAHTREGTVDKKNGAREEERTTKKTRKKKAKEEGRGGWRRGSRGKNADNDVDGRRKEEKSKSAIGTKETEWAWTIFALHSSPSLFPFLPTCLSRSFLPFLQHHLPSLNPEGHKRKRQTIMLRVKWERRYTWQKWTSRIIKRTTPGLNTKSDKKRQENWKDETNKQRMSWLSERGDFRTSCQSLGIKRPREEGGRKA